MLEQTYNVGVKIKVFTGFLLALILGSCPCLMTLAAAHGGGADRHSCCKGSDQKETADEASSCCLRAPLPASAAVPAADLRVVGEARFPAIAFNGAGQERRRLDSAALSPPGDPLLYSRTFPRAPPALG